LEQKDKPPRHAYPFKKDQSYSKSQKLITMENVSGSREATCLYGPVAGHATGITEPTTTCPGRNTPAGFLTHSFMPVYYPEHDNLRNERRVQREYFRSARNLADLFCLEVPDVQYLPYPYNINESYSQLARQLEEKVPDLSLAIVQGTDGKTTLATAIPLDLGYSTYYVPIYPAYRLMRKPHTRGINPVILEILRFLFHRFSLPYFRDEGTYLYDTYNAIDNDLIYGREVFENITQERWYAAQKKRLWTAGDLMKKRISKGFELKRLINTLYNFRPITPTERDLADLGQLVIWMERQYPDRCFYDDIPVNFFDPQHEERIHKGQYISFCYDLSNDWWHLIDNIIQSDFENSLAADSPAVYQYFSTPQRCQAYDDQYMITALNLIDEFAYILNKLCYDRHYGKI
jgi:hypothetical protein